MPAPKINPAVIDLVARFFNSHKKGLPEWLKNAREAYLRLGTPEAQRQIIINYQRDSAPQYLECIDFVGISGNDIEKNYLEWANPDAAASGLKAGQAEGGQGNGGKAYLRQLFGKGYFVSICGGKLSVVSFTDDQKYHLEFVPNELQGRDIDGDSPALAGIRAYAAGWLKAFKLPADHNITIVRGITPAKPVDVDRLFDDLQQSPQARQTVRTCTVQFFVNRAGPRALQIHEPPLHPDFPNPIVVKVPINLPYHSLNVPTAKLPDYPQGELELRVSAKPLHGQALANWNRIDFHGNGVSVIGYKEVLELPLNYGQYASHLFGRCSVPLLVNPHDNYELQGRGPLNEGPLSAALYRFIGSEADVILSKLAKSLENTAAGKKRKNLERLNAKLAAWIESKMVNIGGFSETGEGEGGGKAERKKREHKNHDPAVMVKIHRDKLDICLGVKSYELRAVAYDATGKPVPPGKVTWKSNDPSIVAIDSQTGKVEPRSTGVSTIVVKSDTGLSSMPMLVQVHEAAEIKIKTSSPAKVGSNRRLPISVVVVTPSGQTVKNPALEWKTSNRFVVSVGQDGNAVGGEVGDADVIAVAGSVGSNTLQIEVEKGAAGKPKGGGKGRPQILLSDQDTCPFDHSRVLLNETDPPVYQRPYKPDYDNNVFWINLQHPLAAELLKAGEESVRWRAYHFERIVDVFVMIEVRRKFGDNENLDVDQLLDEINFVKTEIYAQAKTELFDLLYDEKFDLTKLVA
jgi:hypothetical protein